MKRILCFIGMHKKVIADNWKIRLGKGKWGFRCGRCRRVIAYE